MGLFDFLKPKPSNGKFISESRYKEKRARQVAMTPLTLEELRKISICSDQELKLEYFFYTNTSTKASELANEMASLNYKVEHGQSAGDKTLFIVTGWTSKMKMSKEVVQDWTEQICDLGYKYDCEFDGWGTTPDQE